MDHFCESSPHFRKENHQGHGFCSDAMDFFLKKISAVKLKRLLSWCAAFSSVLFICIVNRATFKGIVNGERVYEKDNVCAGIFQQIREKIILSGWGGDGVTGDGRVTNLECPDLESALKKKVNAWNPKDGTQNFIATFHAENTGCGAPTFMVGSHWTRLLSPSGTSFCNVSGCGWESLDPSSYSIGTSFGNMSGP